MKWFRNILRGSTLATALFIFQACYGIPQGALYETGLAPMTFSLVSGETGQPIEGISIKVYSGERSYEIGTTGTDGRCRVEIPYARNDLGPKLTFQDPAEAYFAKDTTLADLREREIVIQLKPAK